LGVMTLNSLGRVLPWWFSPSVNKSPMSSLFSVTFGYLVICIDWFCLLVIY